MKNKKAHGDISDDVTLHKFCRHSVNDDCSMGIQKKTFVVYFQFKRLNNFIDKVWRNQLIEGCFIATSIKGGYQ